MSELMYAKSTESVFPFCYLQMVTHLLELELMPTQGDTHTRRGGNTQISFNGVSLIIHMPRNELSATHHPPLLAVTTGNGTNYAQFMSSKASISILPKRGGG